MEATDLYWTYLLSLNYWTDHTRPQMPVLVGCDEIGSTGHCEIRLWLIIVLVVVEKAKVKVVLVVVVEGLGSGCWKKLRVLSSSLRQSWVMWSCGWAFVAGTMRATGQQMLLATLMFTNLGNLKNFTQHFFNWASLYINNGFSANMY